MKLQRTTLILPPSAGVGRLCLLYEIQGATQRQSAKAKEQQIFSFEEDQVQPLQSRLRNKRWSLSVKPVWSIQMVDEGSSQTQLVMHRYPI